MPVVRLPDEEREDHPGKHLETYHSTAPVDLDGLMREVGALDCIVEKIVGCEVQPKEVGEPIRVGDVITVNMNHSIRSKPEDGLRKSYAVIGAVQNGYKIRELPFTLIGEADIPQVVEDLFRLRPK